jgi:hypothetical protein
VQVLELQQAHPGTLLMVEVGYKYRFYGEDAKVSDLMPLNVYRAKEKDRLPPKSWALPASPCATSFPPLSLFTGVMFISRSTLI